MDLSRTFDYVLHDILLAKLAAYGVEESFLCYTYFQPLNRKQCVRIYDMNIDFLNVILVAPQGSIVGPILYVSLMRLFTLLKLLMLIIFDNNTLTAFPNNN